MRRNVLKHHNKSRKHFDTMIIDIVIIILLLLAIILGVRQGLLTQICYLLAIVATTVIAPDVAAPIGLNFTDSEISAHAIGFGIMLLGAIILAWVIAPLLKKLLFWDVLRNINTLLGAVVAVTTIILLLAMLCTSLDTANLGEIDRERVGELISTCDSEEELESKFNMMLDKDASMRDYYKSQYIDFKTLDESRLFYKFVALGNYIYPAIGSLHNEVEDIKQYAKKSIAEKVIDNDFTK